MAVFANIGGWIADTLVSRGLSITNVRKARNTLFHFLIIYMSLLPQKAKLVMLLSVKGVTTNPLYQ